MKRKRKRWTISVRTDLDPHPLDKEIMRLCRQVVKLARQRGIDLRAQKHRGKVTPPEVREKIAAAQRGRPKAPESCERMSQAHKGKRLTPAHRANVSRALIAAYREGRRD